MTVQTIDLTNYRDRTGGRVPEGDYLVQIEELEQGQSKAGADMWTLYLRVVGGEFDGVTLLDRLTMSEKALFRVVGFLTAMGKKIERKRISLDPQSFVGRKVRVTVADGEPYNGTIRSDVRSYTRYLAQEKTVDELSALDADDAPAEEPAAPQRTVAATADALDTSLDASLDDLDL